jgi:hypothetical protein
VVSPHSHVLSALATSAPSVCTATVTCATTLLTGITGLVLGVERLCLTLRRKAGCTNGVQTGRDQLSHSTKVPFDCNQPSTMALPANLFSAKHNIPGSHSAADIANSDSRSHRPFNKDNAEDEVLLPAERV